MKLHGGLDAALYVDNLFNSQDLLDAQLGRSGCTNLSCTAYSYNNRLIPEYTFRPRTVGITVSYKTGVLRGRLDRSPVHARECAGANASVNARAKGWLMARS